MKRWIATLAAAALVGVAACGGSEETDGGAGAGLETEPPGGPTADTTGIAGEAMGGDTAVPPATGH